MKIVKPYAKILSLENLYDGIVLLRSCETAARVSHRSEERMTLDSWDKFLRFVVMTKGDFSVIEHRSVTVEAVVDRGITHEIVRHRIGSYTQESTRFCNYNKSGEIKIICPFTSDGNTLIPGYHAWGDAMRSAENFYLSMIDQGCSPQIARSVLPNSLASKIWITFNLRQWRLFFLMRTSIETHPQMLDVMVPLLDEFKQKVPIFYEDIISGARQADNMRKMR